MALHVPKAPGFAQMLKEGARVSVFGFKYIKSLINSLLFDKYYRRRPTLICFLLIEMS